MQGISPMPMPSPMRYWVIFSSSVAMPGANFWNSGILIFPTSASSASDCFFKFLRAFSASALLGGNE